MLVNHTVSISPARQHKRKKACLFTANFEKFEKSSLARIKDAFMGQERAGGDKFNAILGPVHTYADIFENGGLFLRF